MGLAAGAVSQPCGADNAPIRMPLAQTGRKRAATVGSRVRQMGAQARSQRACARFNPVRQARFHRLPP